MTEVPPATTASPPTTGGTAAASVISEFLRVQADVAPRSALARTFGKSPLSTNSRPWYLGALGEVAVAERLAGLDDEWTVLHSVPIGNRGSDIDHLAIGPGGVFTINTKFHEGARVWLASRRLLVNGQKTDHLRNARFEASRVSKILAREPGAVAPASGIVVLVGIKQLTVKSRPDDVTVLRDTELVRWLRKRPTTMSAERLAELTKFATDPLTWGGSTPTPDMAAFAALRRTVERAHRVKLAWGTALLAAALISIFGVSQLLLQSLG